MVPRRGEAAILRARGSQAGESFDTGRSAGQAHIAELERRQLMISHAATPERKEASQTHRRKAIFPLFVIGLIYLGHSVAGRAQAPESSGSPAAPPSASTSATASESSLAAEDGRHWQNFLKLAAKPNGLVTQQDVDAAFGEKLVYGTQQFPDYGYKLGHFLRYFPSGNPLYLAKFPERKLSSTNLTFQDKDPKTCLTESKITHDLQKAGWKFSSHEPGRRMPPTDGGTGNSFVGYAPPNDIFQKGERGVVFVQYPTKCPSDLSMHTDREW